jgi:hypothetical protein
MALRFEPLMGRNRSASIVDSLREIIGLRAVSGPTMVQPVTMTARVWALS